MIQLLLALIKLDVEYSVELEKGFMRPSVSPWGASVLMVKKERWWNKSKLQGILGSSIGCGHSKMLSVDEWTSFL